MPKLGLEMTEGAVVEWHADEGEEITAGSTVVEIESEKTTAEVDAREDGVLRRRLVSVGERVPPGTPIGIVAGPAEDIGDLEAEAQGQVATAEAEPGDGSVESAETATAGDTEAEGRADAATEGRAGESDATHETKATPRARRRARDVGLDLRDIEGTGPEGAITEADVERTLEAGESGESDATPSPGADDGLPPLTEERPLSGMRRTIAERLGESYRNAVHVTEHRTADAEEILSAADAAERTLEVDVSILDVLLLAVSEALATHPAVNATFENETHRIYGGHNIGVAVDVEGGLVAPVLRDVNEKSIETIATERRDLTERTLAGEYTTADLRGGTFTVTNLGPMGVEQFDPVINPPQVAILGVNAVQERVVPHEGEVAIRRQLPLSLSFDHRIIDGADAARFLETLVTHIEDPWPLLPDAIERPDD